jgi:CRP/FNR family cyclic AMP-dependent transcriptional regulator
MTIDEKKRILKEHPLFRGLNETALDFTAERVKEKTYPPHTHIINQDDIVDNVYFIYQGLVKVYLVSQEGKYIPVKVTGEKDFVGDLGAVDNGPVPATVEAIQETHALAINKADFNQVIYNYSQFAINLLDLWAKKVRIINEQRENSFSLPLKERVLSALQTLAPHFTNNEITLTQEELANIVGATRARVTEVLNELQTEKFIQLANRKIKVL